MFFQLVLENKYIQNIGQVQQQIALIPLGGYVKMKGQDDTNPALVESGNDSYNTKNHGKELLYYFAGPFTNFLCLVIYFSIALMGASTLAPVIGNVSKNSVAFHWDYKK